MEDKLIKKFRTEECEFSFGRRWGGLVEKRDKAIWVMRAVCAKRQRLKWWSWNVLTTACVVQQTRIQKSTILWYFWAIKKKKSLWLSHVSVIAVGLYLWKECWSSTSFLLCKHLSLVSFKMLRHEHHKWKDQRLIKCWSDFKNYSQQIQILL